jgi:hypothetical protein
MVVSFEVTRRRKSPKLSRRSKASRDAPTIGISDIKQGSFVGVTARADGSESALEVHIFLAHAATRGSVQAMARPPGGGNPDQSARRGKSSTQSLACALWVWPSVN